MEKQVDKKTIIGANAQLALGGQGVSHHNLIKAKFKDGDTVRIVGDDRDDGKLLNTLAVVTKVSTAGGHPHYSLVSLHGHGGVAWFDEEDLRLALAVEDLIKTANSKLV